MERTHFPPPKCPVWPKLSDGGPSSEKAQDGLRLGWRGAGTSATLVAEEEPWWHVVAAGSCDRQKLVGGRSTVIQSLWRSSESSRSCAGVPQAQRRAQLGLQRPALSWQGRVASRRFKQFGPSSYSTGEQCSRAQGGEESLLQAPVWSLSARVKFRH